MPLSRLIKKIVILVVILMVPGFLYYLLVKKGQNRYHPLPVYGPKKLSSRFHLVHGRKVPDTIYHTLGNFSLTDQDGRVVRLGNMNDKIFVADFFYSNCSGLCHTMNGYIDSLAKLYAHNPMLYFLSITVDPARDTPQVLKKYSMQFPDRNSHWLFLRGDTSTVYPLARRGFLVNAVDAGDGNFIYSDQIVLVDSHRRIRGFYTGGSVKEIIRLNDEIKVLLSQELRDRDTPMY